MGMLWADKRWGLADVEQGVGPPPAVPGRAQGP